jgi:hypothetical protein
VSASFAIIPVPELSIIETVHRFEKLKFSMMIPEVEQLLTTQLKPESVIIVGIEVCVVI